jgi:hypothetical protein
MNIPEELLSDKTQSKAMALRVSDYACTSEKQFNELMACFTSDDNKLAQRAAWSMRWAAEKRPDLIIPHVGSLVKQLNRVDVHDAVIRNSLKVLECVVNIPEEYHGAVLDACFGLLSDRKTPIAIKVFSMSLLFKLSNHYPEIKNELRLIVQENMELETAAFRSRGRKILQAIR